MAINHHLAMWKMALALAFDIYIAKRVAKEILGDENKVESVLVEAQNLVEYPQCQSR